MDLGGCFCFFGLSNTIKYFVVNCVGCCLEDVDSVNDESASMEDHEEDLLNYIADRSLQEHFKRFM